MTPGMVAAWVVGLLAVLVAGVTLAALWPQPRPRRRRALRAETPRAVAFVVDDPTPDEHDWDGFLRDLTPQLGDEPTVELDELGLRAERIQLPREGEAL